MPEYKSKSGYVLSTCNNITQGRLIHARQLKGKVTYPRAKDAATFCI